MLSLADTIKRIRQRLDENMAEFAETIGTQQSTISGYEAGQLVPSKSILILLLLLADKEEKPTILANLGAEDESAIRSQFSGAVKALDEFRRVRSGRNEVADELRTVFAKEAAAIASSEAPVDELLVEFLRLWRTYSANKEFRKAVSHMLPYFRFSGTK